MDIMYAAAFIQLLLLHHVHGDVKLKQATTEDSELTRLIRHILETKYPKCSLGLGMDYPDLSPGLQDVIVWSNRHRPVVISRMDSFQYDPSEYPWIWKHEHLLSFRTQPPELRSRLWPGGSCAFNLILARNTSSVPELIMHTAAHFMIRNIKDPVMIHVHGNSTPHLLTDPLNGITFKLLTQFDHTLLLHTVCYFCNSGHHDVNPPFEPYTGPDMFPSPPRNMNGRKWLIGNMDEIALEGARSRKKQGEQLTFAETAVLLIESVSNAHIEVVVPDISSSEFYQNGSLAGMTKPVLSKEVSMMLITLNTEVSAKALMLTNPLVFWHVTFVTRYPRLEIKWYVIIKPFSLGMWATLAMSIGFSAICLQIFERSSRRFHMFKMVFQRVVMNAKMMTRLLLEQTHFPAHTGSSVGMLLSFLLFFATIVTCAYRTKLVAFITYPPTERLPETAKELTDSTMRLGITSLIAILAGIFLQDVPASHPHRQILQRAEISETIHDCLHKTQTGYFACVLPNADYQRERYYFMDEKGHLGILKSPSNILNVFLGSGFGRDDIYFDHFNFMAIHAFEASIIRHLEDHVNYRMFLKNYFEKRKANPEVPFFEYRSLLDFDRLASSLGMWLVGMVLSCLVLFAEMCGVKSRHSKGRVIQVESKPETPSDLSQPSVSHD